MENTGKILKKRGRKPKNLVNETPEMDVKEHIEELVEPNKPKKRGRKPKGGKIIEYQMDMGDQIDTKPNVILHLKCSLKDTNKSFIDNNIETFNFQDKPLLFNIVENSGQHLKDNDNNDNNKKEEVIDRDIPNDDIVSTNKVVYNKLKQLQQNLHFNNCSEKKSACFWCTYDFDSPPIFIPKFFIRETYHVYGCFCSPECAAAHLMSENIDSSVKFERYYLLNYIYCKIYEYNKNIKPAPNPQHLLDKFYGNLTINEYRSLFKNERLLLIVEKPLTRILPELHEDNDDFIINNKIIPSNNYQIKKSFKKINKNSILNETFGGIAV
jgi:hypothetical protein